MTYVRTWSGWAYVAFILDVYSRMIVGWQVANHMRTELPLDALEVALWRRRIKKDSGLIHHSDRGSQYVSIRHTAWWRTGGEWGRNREPRPAALLAVLTGRATRS
ncbi:DDE-type integrase/transposase/recombinase [Streptomyces sioyaensis]|uniref:DDE-type integrase/transposase/recombinase n=1 Tax=Streptomyces sioyaensis TaxID=67364 RepID=UPI00378F7905